MPVPPLSSITTKLIRLSSVPCGVRVRLPLGRIGYVVGHNGTVASVSDDARRLVNSVTLPGVLLVKVLASDVCDAIDHSVYASVRF